MDEATQTHTLMALLVRQNRLIERLRLSEVTARAERDTLMLALAQAVAAGRHLVPRDVVPKPKRVIRFNPKPCGDCGNPFVPRSGSQQFCPNCQTVRQVLYDATTNARQRERRVAGA